jgi:circadian clock protein KaiB
MRLARPWTGACPARHSSLFAAARSVDKKCLRGGLSAYLLKLYVRGGSVRADVAIANLRRICADQLRGQYDLEIIDVLEHPELAEADKILATPTLIKQLPPPLRRIIGDLSDTERVLVGLEVRPESTGAHSRDARGADAVLPNETNASDEPAN